MAPETNPKINIMIDKMRQKGTLPAMPENTSDLSNLTQLSSTCAADLASVIMRDCGLTTSILVNVNSSYYSPKYPIKTVSTAVTFMGFEKVRALALGISIFQATAKSIKKPELRQLYANSYFSGTMAMQLAREYKYTNPEEIFIAGLLHKLPMLTLANTFPEKFQKLERLVKEKGFSFDKAVFEIFDINYSELCENIHNLFNLPGKVTDILENKVIENDPLKNLVNNASAFADMLFGETKGGKKAIKQLEDNIELILHKDFVFEDFIQKTCQNDKNITKFFNLEEEDIEIMVNVLQWGKISPAQVVSKLAFGDILNEKEEKPDPTQLIGHFLTELSLALRRNYDINQVLMLAQEAIFNCVVDSDIFITFLDTKNNLISGKLYTGSNLLIQAKSFKVDLKRTGSAIVKCIKTGDPQCWKAGEASLGLPASIIKRLQIKHAIILPIQMKGHIMGAYFISRKIDIFFSELEETWLEQIITSVEKAFVKNSKK